MKYPKPKVGDTVYWKAFASSTNSKPQYKEAKVTKVGRKFFYVAEVSWTDTKVSLQTWRVAEERGLAYAMHPSLEALKRHEELESMKHAISRITWHKLESISSDAIEQAAKLLEVC